ncbi:MAG: ABC transporter ATP-binding protein, partial [Pseudomonadota bacterium]
MIRALLDVAGPEAAAPLRRNIAGLIIESVLTGIGFVLLVPLISALLERNMAGAWYWLIAMGGVFAAYCVVRYRTQLLGYLAAIGLARALFAQ